MVCVKYCVFAIPLVSTAVQTHGGVQSALRSIHAPTRNEEGTYIRASVASDLDTLSTPNIPSHQGMMMNIFLLGGWVARPSAFYFPPVLCSPCLILPALSFVVAWLYLVLNLSLLFVVSLLIPVICIPCTLSPYLFLVCLAFPPSLVKSINDFPHNE